MENIKKIAGVVGEVVDIDDEAADLQRLDRARVLIKTPWHPTINHRMLAYPLTRSNMSIISWRRHVTAPVAVKAMGTEPDVEIQNVCRQVIGRSHVRGSSRE